MNPSIPFFGGPTCPAAPEQLQGDSFDQAMVEVVGAIGQARMCEFWGTDLTEAMEQSHPWDEFSAEWRQWYLDPPKDFSPPQQGSGSGFQTIQPSPSAGHLVFAGGSASTGSTSSTSSLAWTLVRQDGLTSVVDITSNGTPILELQVESLKDYCPNCSANTVPFWGVTGWTFLDR